MRKIFLLLLLCMASGVMFAQVKIACIGNSITYGYGIDNHEEYSYPAQLDKMLGDGYEVQNFGINSRTLLNKGDLPYMKEPIYQEALAFQPDIVIIKLGTNDSKPQNWQYADDYVKDYIMLIESFEALPEKPIIYLCYPTFVEHTNWGITDKVVHDEIIPKVKQVAKSKKLKIIDLYKPMKGHSEWFCDDGIHPNAEGAQIIAQTVKKAISKK